MPKAKYEGIYHSIKKRIEAQDYPYQSLLPSENTLIAVSYTHLTLPTN